MEISWTSTPRDDASSLKKTTFANKEEAVRSEMEKNSIFDGNLLSKKPRFFENFGENPFEWFLEMMLETYT